MVLFGWIMKLRFRTVDVFTNRKFGGNPLAVVLGADGLETAQMQSIAAEFNLAETTFVLPPVNSANTATVRIFTPQSEMPFAGHPNIGTAFVLATEGCCEMGRISFEEKAGLVELRILESNGRIIGARLTAPQPLQVGAEVDWDAVAQACGLKTSDIIVANHRPCLISCGVPFVVAEVAHRTALSVATSNVAFFRNYFPPQMTTGIHLYTRETQNNFDLQARMFAPLMGVPEDPATGSANVALAGLLCQLQQGDDARIELRIGQGFDMGRPSVLEASARKIGGDVMVLEIGGECVSMMDGFINL
jgi:trans-2,3-dihydro-3-hydroxyanthranilate isomerase